MTDFVPGIPIRVNPAVRPHVVRSGLTIAADHPLHSGGCPVCWAPLREGPVSLVLIGRESSGSWTAATVAVHDACAGEPTDG